jgi:hypothetical protein
MKLSYFMDYGQKERFKKIRKVRRTKDSHQHDSDRDSVNGIRPNRKSRRGGAIGIGGEICTGLTAGCVSSRGIRAGGILSQLLEDERVRLVAIDDELERLQRGREAQIERIEYLKEMLQRLNEISDS